jgi:hypothetical protein
MRQIIWGFYINRFGIGPLHYVSSRSDFGFEFAEIFIIEKRLAESGVTRLPINTIFFKPLNKSMVIVHYIPGFFFLPNWSIKFCKNSNSDSPSHHSDSPTFLLNIQKPARRVGESVTRRVGESPSRRVSDSPSRGVVFRLRISPRIRSQNRNGPKGSVKDLWRTNFCKNPRKSDSLPCPFNRR